MKPISVRFQCFGPYLQEQLVDFTQLEQHGLFLICGETGSGKTTILDAICYALYGKSSGGLRGDMSVMRCKQAKLSDETFVEFIFESAGKRYRFFRSLKPRKKRKAGEETSKKLTTTDYNATYECQVLEGEVYVPLADAKDKASFLNDKARELIGLTYDQFRQVIILPQGQFEQLLVSNSEEKEAILVTLFHAQRWQQLAAKLYELADQESKALDREKLLIGEKLRSYGVDSPQALVEMAACLGEEADSAERDEESLRARVAECRQAHETALLENQAFIHRDILKGKMDALLPKQDHFRQETVILERSDRADRITPVYTEYINAWKSLNREQLWMADAYAALETAEKNVAAAKEKRERHERGREVYARNKQSILLLENARTLYLSLEERKRAVAAAEKDLADAAGKAQEAAGMLSNANGRWEQTILAQRRAREEYDSAQQQYLRGIGSTLAQRLQPGEPCPVCGSCSHPAPAMPAGDHVTDAMLDDLGDALNAADESEAAARKRRMAAEQRSTDAQTVLAAKQQEAAVRRSELEHAMSRRIAGVETLQQLETALSDLTKAVENFEKAEIETQKLMNHGVSGLQAAEKTVQLTAKAVESAMDSYKVQQSRWENARTAAGFESDDAYTGACLQAAQKNRRKTAWIQFDTDLTNARKAYAEKLRELEGKTRPDVEQTKQALAEAEKTLAEMRGRLLLARQRYETVKADAAALEARSRSYDRDRRSADESMVFAKRLRGDFGISLQRYVLGVMLTSVTMAANRLLKTVYAGRYQLYRTNEAAGSARKRGLELEVQDANNNERRSVTTLSGGEKFLVSLSLAIGLSSVVQAQGHGVRLEAMFIDEGFGSLDRESVNDALEILQGIRRSAGLIGIISHVEQLAETIPAKIQIVKSKDGSVCEICC